MADETDEAQTRQPVRRLWPFALVAISLLVVLGVGLFWFYNSFIVTKIVLRNVSSQTVYDVEVSLRYSGQKRPATRMESLGPGQTITIVREERDVYVWLDFVLAGSKHHHEEGVDLWTGQTYVFDIQDDGSVNPHYD